MSPQVKKFIEENIEYINRAEFKLLYISLNAMWNPFGSTVETSRQISEFTEVMLNAGIDPLDYLEWIPECYLYMSDTGIRNLNSNKKLNDIDFLSNLNHKEKIELIVNGQCPTTCSC